MNSKLKEVLKTLAIGGAIFSITLVLPLVVKGTEPKVYKVNGEEAHRVIYAEAKEESRYSYWFEEISCTVNVDKIENKYEIVRGDKTYRYPTYKALMEAVEKRMVDNDVRVTEEIQQMF